MENRSIKFFERDFLFPQLALVGVCKQRINFEREDKTNRVKQDSRSINSNRTKQWWSEGVGMFTNQNQMEEIRFQSNLKNTRRMQMQSFNANNRFTKIRMSSLTKNSFGRLIEPTAKLNNKEKYSIKLDQWEHNPINLIAAGCQFTI